METDPWPVCEYCGKPETLAPGIEYFCDNNDCPEKKLSYEERLKRNIDHMLKAFGIKEQKETNDGDYLYPISRKKIQAILMASETIIRRSIKSDILEPANMIKKICEEFFDAIKTKRKPE